MRRQLGDADFLDKLAPADYHLTHASLCARNAALALTWMWLRNSLKQERDATMIVNGVTLMQQVRIYLLLAVLICTVTALGQTVVTTPAVATSGRASGAIFGDCPDCPEMMVIPAGSFTMGSSASEKSWAVSQGAKPGNHFGLYDMVGNVWQWTEDCYAESYASSPRDGSASEAVKDCLRVDRGGSWLYPAWLLRAATRERNPAGYRDVIMGFRLARTLPPEAQPSQQPSAARMVDLKASDGTILKGSYFAAAKPGPGVLLLHQINRTRKAWDDVAGRLAAAGINTLTLDIRGFGESGGKPDKRLTDVRDIDTAFQYLVSQPGVKRDVIGVGGAGSLGVDRSVEVARLRSAQVKSLVLLSGETLRDGLEFMRQASQLPGLFVVADDDEYPPTTEAMELLYITSSNSGKKFVHYSAAQEAPWLWYEPFDVGRVPANGGHGTDMFKVHPELPGIIVDWFVTTLVKTPGHAPADTLASAPIINQIGMPGGVAQVTQQLVETRRIDPKAQLFPEITVSIIGQDHMRAGEPKLAVEVLKLVLLAYPDSADANETLSEAYLADGQKDLARQLAEKALALLNSHTAPASSWTDTEQYRGEIRRGAQKILKKLDSARGN